MKVVVSRPWQVGSYLIFAGLGFVGLSIVAYLPRWVHDAPHQLLVYGLISMSMGLAVLLLLTARDVVRNGVTTDR